jgi:hypothetical protein
MRASLKVFGLFAQMRIVSCMAVAVVSLLCGSHAFAGVISIDLTGLTGQNGGLAAGTWTRINNFPSDATSKLDIYNGSNEGFFGNAYGLSMQTANGGGIAVSGGFCTPIKFGGGAIIDGTSYYEDSQFPSLFGTIFGNKAPVFGPNSFLGFKDSLGRFGYIEVTWDGVDKFKLISAAYESTPGVGIQTPVGGAVPEPTSMAIFGLGALGMAYRARRKSKIHG